MKFKICDINNDAFDLLPPKINDNSRIGVHFMSAYIKPMNVELSDGTKVTCRRRGLKITLGVNAEKGIGLMRRLAISSDPKIMIQAALQEAAKAIGYHYILENDQIFLEKF